MQIAKVDQFCNHSTKTKAWRAGAKESRVITGFRDTTDEKRVHTQLGVSILPFCIALIFAQSGSNKQCWVWLLCASVWKGQKSVGLKARRQCRLDKLVRV